MNWQVQAAKQRFSEVVQRARTDGDQVVTRHGQPVVVVVDYERYRQLTDDETGPSFKELLRQVPDFGIAPPRTAARRIDL